MRRERVTITAHSDNPNVDSRTIEGRLETFRVDTRDEYVPGPGGKFTRQAGASEMRVELVLYLDPESARIFRDRNKPKPVVRLITQRERDYNAALRGMQLLTIGADDATFELATGQIAPSKRLYSCTTCRGSRVVPVPYRVTEYVTREMAIDAGDRSLEGQAVDWGVDWREADCPDCIQQEPSAGGGPF